ncbi:MAG: RNB domain-containing ribonuclease [Betaproteobacteria bacterium]|nr:RNB domain-containing ribonuclease [Betaproteobacteria bacterium]
MFVLFEEDGSFKAGTVLADNDSSLQVENTRGKRVKLKRANVLLEFREPDPAGLLIRAQAAAAEFDTDFLWSVCGDEEFIFTEFAADYYGHKPDAVEAATMLFSLHAAPMWFHRRGKGCFRKAPEDILCAAKAGMEKKRQQAEAIERMRAELAAKRQPPEFDGIISQLLYRPDRNRIEVKALEAACIDTGLSAAKLLLECAALSSSYDYHYNRFLFEQFPEGTDFPPFDPPVFPTGLLPRADVAAFSIDDATTTEIDDAFSVTPQPGGGWKIGIHIAAPALGFARSSTLDAIARRRLSTVYMPGNKITMLPNDVILAFTLSAGHTRPAVSLYLDVRSDLTITGHESRIECVPVVANLRHHDIEPIFNEATLTKGSPDFPWKKELTLLWELATVLEAGRGKPSGNANQVDHTYTIDWEQHTPDGPGVVTIGQRVRGSPLEKLVAELMIFANATWGRLLDESGVAGLYRVQGGGKVRMATVAAPHEGLGVDCYTWSSSPLRRYVDLVNQWQIAAVLNGTTPAFAPRSTDLLEALRDFELAYTEYNEFQRRIERYWCVRWLRQNNVHATEGTVLRDNLVRLIEIPLIFKMPSLPPQLPGSKISLAITGSDLIDVEVEARYLATLTEPGPEAQEEMNY